MSRLAASLVQIGIITTVENEACIMGEGGEYVRKQRKVKPKKRVLYMRYDPPRYIQPTQARAHGQDNKYPTAASMPRFNRANRASYLYDRCYRFGGRNGEVLRYNIPLAPTGMTIFAQKKSNKTERIDYPSSVPRHPPCTITHTHI